MIALLNKYQEKDRELKELETALSSSKERFKVAQAKKIMMGVEENLARLEERAGKTVDMLAEAEKLLKRYVDEKNEFEKIAKDCNDETECTYLIKKCAELGRKIKKLETEAQNCQESCANIVGEYASLKKTYTGAVDQHKQFSPKYKELKESMSGEMEKIKKELAAMEKKIAAEVLQKYKEKRADKIFPIVYSVSNKSCGFCSMELSMSALNELEKGGVIECEQCRRLIYREQK